MTDEEIPVDPKLPRNFDNTPNDLRPASHRAWINRPYIVTVTWEQMSAGRLETSCLDEQRASWFQSWPSGTRYDVRCLDGGAWDRSTWWGAFRTLEEAITCAKRKLPPLK